jgi:hypothetical protein
MADIISFPFEKKEGKYFAPIVSEQTKYKVENGAVVEDGKELISGIKGAFAITKLILPVNQASTKKELFALNSEAVNSSN